MNIKQMEYIVAIADAGNISKAAETLFISRPALNHYLTSLETSLGYPLFHRIHKKLVPTESGAVYIDAAKNILEICNRSNLLIDEINECESGTLKLGITRVIGANMLTHIFPAFHENYPHFTVQLVEAGVNKLENLVSDGTIDFAITGQKTMNTNLDYRTFAPCEIVIAVPLNHPLAADAMQSSERLPLSLATLKNENFVLMSKETKLRTIIEPHFIKAGFEPKIMLETGLSSIAYELVRQGVAPGIIMESAITDKTAVATYSLTPKEYWYSGIAYRKGTIFSKAEQYFMDLAVNYFETLV